MKDYVNTTKLTILMAFTLLILIIMDNLLNPEQEVPVTCETRDLGTTKTIIIDKKANKIIMTCTGNKL